MTSESSKWMRLGVLLAACLLTVACARPPMAVRSADDGHCPLEDDPAENEVEP